MPLDLNTVHNVICLVLFLQSILPSLISSVKMLNKAMEVIVYPTETLKKPTKADVENRASDAIYYMNATKLHETIISSTALLSPDTPAYGFFITSKPDIEAQDLGRTSLLSILATTVLIGADCQMGYYKQDECLRKVSTFDLTSTVLYSICYKISPDCGKVWFSPYRTMDGSCNNLKDSKGKSFTAFSRILPSAYSDGVESPRRSKTKRILPNAREISGILSNFEDIRQDDLTMAVLQWGQFLEKDLSRPAITGMYHYDNRYFRCCADDGSRIQPRYMHKACSTISISNDPFYKKKFKHCMSYIRSLPIVNSNCQFGPRQQMNQATSFLDGSQIYGVTSAQSATLRNFTLGQLKTSTLHGKDYLPLSSDPTNDCLTSDKNLLCFLSGDPRVNFDPQTVAMHTLWVREHNRIAKELYRINNGKMVEEQLFQEARRIVIAEMQVITYKEWAAEVVDQRYFDTLILNNYYDDNLNPSVFNSMAVSVFGAFKSLYPNKINLYSKDNTEDGTLELKEHFYKPSIFKDISKFDSVVRSITSQTMGRLDMNFNEDLINHLYTNGDMGYDTLALDIQRERDHGIPEYNKFRMYIGYSDAKEFSSFGDTMPREHYASLEAIYKRPGDIDLIIGGLLERPLSDSIMGPTFSWLLTNTLWKAKAGDRFFYNRQDQEYSFNRNQISELNKASLARILCDNSDITSVQKNVFKKISETNPMVNCDGDDIPRISLDTAWKFVQS